MSGNARSVMYFAAAIGLHAAAMWGIRMGDAHFAGEEESDAEATEIALVEAAPEGEPEPVEPPPTPAQPPVMPETPPPDAIPDKTLPIPEKPRRDPPPFEPKPKNPVTTKTARVTATANIPTTGAAAASSGKPGPGDSARATWRNRVRPNYPESAKRAGQSGSVQIQLSVNALGQPTGGRVLRGSGLPALDAAALRAALASSFKPKRLAGIPLPDTVIVPYSFRLDDR